MEVKQLDKRASGQSFEVILKSPSDLSPESPVLSSPPKRKDASLEELQKRLEAAEERRKVRAPAALAKGSCQDILPAVGTVPQVQGPGVEGGSPMAASRRETGTRHCWRAGGGPDQEGAGGGCGTRGRTDLLLLGERRRREGLLGRALHTQTCRELGGPRHPTPAPQRQARPRGGALRSGSWRTTRPESRAVAPAPAQRVPERPGDPGILKESEGVDYPWEPQAVPPPAAGPRHCEASSPRLLAPTCFPADTLGELEHHPSTSGSAVPGAHRPAILRSAGRGLRERQEGSVTAHKFRFPLLLRHRPPPPGPAGLAQHREGQRLPSAQQGGAALRRHRRTG